MAGPRTVLTSRTRLAVGVRPRPAPWDRLRRFGPVMAGRPRTWRERRHAKRGVGPQRPFNRGGVSVKQKLIWLVLALATAMQVATADFELADPPLLKPAVLEAKATHLAAELLSRCHYGGSPARRCLVERLATDPEVTSAAVNPSPRSSRSPRHQGPEGVAAAVGIHRSAVHRAIEAQRVIRAPDSAPVHGERHRPEQTTLYRLVQQNAATCSHLHRHHGATSP